jgi:hypothetical protein
MAVWVFLFSLVASGSFSADNSNSAGVSDALATSDSQLVGQTLAADAKDSYSTG